MKLAVRGITLVVASGDAGSPGRTNEGCDPTMNLINPVLPGSSPWILSVGATFVNQNDEQYNYKTPICKEQKCATGLKTQSINFNQTGWTTGSGFGIYLSEWRPKWQKNFVQEYLNSGVFLPDKKNWNINGRGYPDISMVGHNCPVLDGNEYEMVDGTSCSTPLIAGIIAILNDHQISKGKPKLGFVNPLLYQMANQKGIFKKPIETNTYCTETLCCNDQFGFQGSNSLWDPVSGLGEPNVTAMIEYLDNNI
jgi:tripeptidyl-peptidase-1